VCELEIVCEVRDGEEGGGIYPFTEKGRRRPPQPFNSPPTLPASPRRTWRGGQLDRHRGPLKHLRAGAARRGGNSRNWRFFRAGAMAASSNGRRNSPLMRAPHKLAARELPPPHRTKRVASSRCCFKGRSPCVCLCGVCRLLLRQDRKGRNRRTTDRLPALRRPLGHFVFPAGGGEGEKKKRGMSWWWAGPMLRGWGIALSVCRQMS